MAAQYRLRTDDVLQISVWGHSDLKQEVIVGPDGFISFPLVGNVKATGLTTDELKTEITVKLSDYLREPKVNLYLIKYQKVNVMVLGAVKKPGTYQMEAGKKVLDALASSGGPEKMADLAEVKITREDISKTINLEEVYRGKSPQGNMELQDGDVLFVPEGSIEVTVMGEVNSPGRYELEKGLKLSDLIARAGGLTSTASDKANFTSGDEVKSYDLHRLIEGSSEDNPVLQDGDSLYVSKTIYEVTILGEVNRPGSYLWNEEMRLADLLARAGNETDRGDIEKIKLMHRNRSAATYNLEEYFNGQAGENPSLEPGDVVMVKELETSADVTILGEVNRPGSYSWNENMSLADLLARAGNQTERGDIEEIKLMHRDGVTTAVNLEEYLSGKGGKNPLLQSGDVVMVKEVGTSADVTILGEVNRPGSYPWNENLKLADLLARAGNQTERGDIEKIKVMRRDGSSEFINLKGYLSDQGGENPTLEPGDVVMVEELETSADVTILGEVNSPGSFPWNENLKLADLLGKAGNQTRVGDIEKIKVMNRSGKAYIYNLKEYFKGQEEENPLLEPGDIVMVKEMDIKPEVTILGEVNRPGSYTWAESMKLTDLLAQAGNSTKRGDLKSIKLLHRSGQMEVKNIESYLTEGTEEENPVLKPGDLVIVEELKTSPEVTILGEVNKPGTYQWDENLHLVDLLARAGNEKERGDLESIKILHSDGTGITVNLDKYYSGDDLEANPLLRPGDIVKIGELSGVDWQKVFGFVSGLNIMKNFLDINW